MNNHTLSSNMFKQHKKYTSEIIDGIVTEDAFLSILGAFLRKVFSHSDDKSVETFGEGMIAYMLTAWNSKLYINFLRNLRYVKKSITVVNDQIIESNEEVEQQKVCPLFYNEIVVSRCSSYPEDRFSVTEEIWMKNNGELMVVHCYRAKKGKQCKTLYLNQGKLTDYNCINITEWEVKNQLEAFARGY